MHKLATVRRVVQIKSIPGANNIQLAIVDGWEIVVRINLFCAGDLAILFKSGSFLPVTSVLSFLGQPTKYRGNRGYRIRDRVFMGIKSPGLLIPFDSIDTGSNFLPNYPGADITDMLGVVEHVKGPSRKVKNILSGPYPDFLPKITYSDPRDDLSMFSTKSHQVFEKSIKMGGCFPPEAIVDLWDGSKCPISQIDEDVSRGFDVYVKGVLDGKVIKSKVLKVHDNGTKMKWSLARVRSKSDTVKYRIDSTIVATPNHSVFMYDYKEVPFGSLALKDILLAPVDLLDDFGWKYVSAALLCGASVLKTQTGFLFEERLPSCSQTHGIYLYNLFSNCKHPSIDGDPKWSIRLDPNVLSKFREEWYQYDNKSLPKDLSWVDDFVIGKFISEKGIRTRCDAFLDIHCGDIPVDDCSRLCKKIGGMYGVQTFVISDNGYWIRIRDYMGLVDKVGAFTPRFSRTIPFSGKSSFRDYPKITTRRKLVPASVVKTSSMSDRPRKAYDLTTSSGNYVCGEVLVHNSDMIVFDSSEHKVSPPRDPFCWTFSINPLDIFNWIGYRFFNRKPSGICADGELTFDHDDKFWKAATRDLIFESLSGTNCALYGVLSTPNSSNGKENLKFYVHSIYSFDLYRFLAPNERISWLKLNDPAGNISHVPFIEYTKPFSSGKDIKSLVKSARMTSRYDDTHAMGVVYKSGKDVNLFVRVDNPDFEI